MDLRTAIADVTTLGYAPGKGRTQPAQQHLRQVYRELPALLPPGLLVRVSGSGRSLPYVPWIAVLNPEVTRTAQEGLYLVYLYRSDLSLVYLTMNQGATQHRDRAVERGLRGRAADDEAISELLHESHLLHDHLSPATLAGLSGLEAIDLGEPGRFYPKAYEARHDRGEGLPLVRASGRGRAPQRPASVPCPVRQLRGTQGRAPGNRS